MPDPRSPTWRACHCFHSNICLEGLEKDSSNLGEAWGVGEHASCLEVWLVQLAEGVWGSVWTSTSVFGLGAFCTPLRQLGEL